ncbi:glycoside hydrolase family 13 protein [Reinekea blandensis]|uniref:Glycosyl hydrolase, family 13 n=1 Tax=Reinekea blandensis MED297 TaxID=314283 RepID=A4BHB8_9GAMM|nr:glycoside hydrolase family 13 protein [Reinekea blandensis]EAR08466.1 glycosyl hydrolase, family 13 [Reinekea sp. MED297] [Reinekea blandensis MED297]
MTAINTPDWVKSAVFYQVFPDRFARGKQHQPPAGITFKDWGADPAEQGFQGGDLYGVAEHLDDIQALGVTALYLNPIFSSASNHRYHTFDYRQVDPLLGGDEALRFLLDEAHRRGMKVMLDGVFNHASRGFWAFHHILENGPESPYLDWFHIEDFPLNPYPKDSDEALNYRAWWDLPALPKFNTDNPGVREYLFSVAEQWIRFGIDGWRLDVPGDIDDDTFWQEFRRRVKGLNPDAYICGEIWGQAERWLQGDQFDAVMNYPMGTAALSYFGASTIREGYQQNEYDIAALDAEDFCTRIDTVQGWYHRDINAVQLNLIDSHDTPRAMWLVQENEAAVGLALSFLLLMPGAPCLYYGTEIGMSGGNDPDCRGAYPWDDPDQWKPAIGETFKAMAKIRQSEFFHTDAEVTLTALTNDVLLLERVSSKGRLVAFINRGQEATVSVPEHLNNLFALSETAEKSKHRLKDDIQLKKNATEVFVS